MTCGTLNITTGLATYCTACDPGAVATRDVDGFADERHVCSVCDQVMTGYLAYGHEYLVHGTNCSECVACAPRPARSFDDVALTPQQYRLLEPFSYAGDIVVAVDEGASIDEAIADLALGPRS